jgi:rRNA-processing protein FCF1
MIPEQCAAKLRKRRKERERYHSDPAYRAKRLARSKRRHKERYRTDPAYRAKLIEAARVQYATDPEFRKRLR